MLCFSALNDIAMLSFCGSHHCVVCPPQKTITVFKTVCEISISVSEDPIYTHPHKPWQPEFARNLIALLEVSLKCLKWLFRIVKPGISSAQSTGVQWHYLPLQRLFEWCVPRHPEKGTIQVSGVVLSFLSPCFLDATWTSIRAQRGWILGGTKTSL